MNNQILKTFLSKWSSFLSMLVDPWSLITIILIVANLKLITSVDDSKIKLGLNLLLSIFSAALGARMWNEWTALTEGHILIARGKTAIRALKLLHNEVSSLECRARRYYSSDLKEPKATENLETIFKIGLEEVSERCTNLQESVINSIENWVDIIPEADVRTQIGMITALKIESTNLQKEIVNMRAELERSKNESQDEKQKVKEKEEQLEKVKKELKEKNNNLNSSILSGLNTNPPFSTPLDNSLTKNWLSERGGIVSDDKWFTILERLGSNLKDKPNS